jgi:cytochrome P450
MLVRPDVQKKAQAEMDALVGSERLPDFSDIEHAPFTTAVVCELLRWLPVLPLGESISEL